MITILANLLKPVVIPMGVSEADLLYYLNAVSGYLTALLVLLALVVVVMVGAVKIKKGWKAFARIQSVLVFLAAAVIIVNQICYGPLYNNISGFLNASKVELADDVVAQSLETIEKIGEGGIVLAKNDDLLPLQENVKKLNVFGWDSIHPLLGGTGSSASSAAAATDLLGSLENAGYEVNETLTKMYRDYRDERPAIDMNSMDLTLPEPTMDYYTDEMLEEAKEFSDTALLVFGRPGGEDYDLPTDMNAVIHGTYNTAKTVSVQPDNYTYFNMTYENNGDYDDFEEGESYLELSATEEKLVDLVCANFSNVIVVINATNTMELGWVDEYEQIKSVLLAPAPGVAGFAGLGKIISGEVNPSGKTADTYVKDLFATPYINNIGDHSFTNVDDMKKTIAKADSTYEGSAAFVNYNEGIYVGYKFYETAAEEGLIDYDETVQYPFGYGLSYTTFDRTISGFKDAGDSITFDVKVKNTGDTAGKDVVEIYYTPPYTNGGIEKASANLIDFEKTDLLEPGASQTVSFTIAKEDMASYDSECKKTENGGYILEAGEYRISVRSDSHTIVDEVTFTVKEDVDYSKDGRESDQQTAVNQFEDYSRGDFVQLSRADGFANYGEAVKEPEAAAYEMDEETQAAVQASAAGYYESSVYDNDGDAMPVMGEKNGVVLADLAGLSYDDEKWDALLDELSFKDMTTLVNVGGWQTVEIKSIEKRATSDCDGPAGLNNFVTGSYGTTFPSEVLMAQTWSKELALEIGTSMGSEFAAAENYGWYGPAMNLHRSAFAGRNFEYFSEDGILSAYMASNEQLGAAQWGVYSYIKHFVLNDQETNRCGILLTYASEQAIRENYLKPFEKTVKNYTGKSLAVMAAYNWIGTKPCYANSNLLNEVLRGEWGFEGLVESDYDGSYGFMISDNAMRNGTDLMLGYGSYDTNKLDAKSATLANAMRRASKNILYTIVNSGYYSEGTPLATEDHMGNLFHTINTSAAAVLGMLEVLLILWQILTRKKARKKAAQADEGNTAAADGQEEDR